MKSNRRKFLRQFTIGAGSLASLPAFVKKDEKDIFSFLPNQSDEQHFNMCGYAAPKIETVRVGIVGLGMRGSEAVRRLSYIDGLEIIALCDKYPNRVAAAQKTLEDMQRPKAKEFTGDEGWKALCESSDIDLVYTPTPWSLHTPIAVYAMKNGKHAATEVPAAKTLDQCWELVETSEKTKKHCMMLENCCYDFFELLTLNMVRNGMFGEIVHAEGAYIHDLSKEYIFNKDGYADMWRLKENIGRNGNLYPTHGLGPIAQVMNINRGDKMDYLVSLSSNDFQMGRTANELASKDAFYKPYAGKHFRGNMNTTMIKTNSGRTMMLQHDVTSPNVYSRIHKVSGTKASALKYPLAAKIAVGHEEWLSDKEFQELEAKYQPPIVKKLGEVAKQVGGHGGMDFLMDWRTIDCLRNGLPLDIDVYDAALWSSISPLTEVSVANRSKAMDIPDFTRGAWKTNKPVDILLEKGANTKVLA